MPLIYLSPHLFTSFSLNKNDLNIYSSNANIALETCTKTARQDLLQ